MIDAVQVRAGAWVVALPLGCVRRLVEPGVLRIRREPAATPGLAEIDGVAYELWDLDRLLRLDAVVPAAVVLLERAGRLAALRAGPCLSVGPVPDPLPLPAPSLRSGVPLGCYPTQVAGAAAVGLWLDPAGWAGGR
jgi:hypothetical protein